MHRHPWTDERDRKRREALQFAQQRIAVSRPLQLAPAPAAPPHPAPVPPAAVTGMGILALLPNETIMGVLARCTFCALLALLRVNRSAAELVRLLPKFAFVRETAMLTVRRARPLYRRVMAKIMRITTYDGLRFLLATYECEGCGKPGAAFRMVRVKVLCDACHAAHTHHQPPPLGP